MSAKVPSILFLYAWIAEKSDEWFIWLEYDIEKPPCPRAPVAKKRS